MVTPLLDDADEVLSEFLETFAPRLDRQHSVALLERKVPRFLSERNTELCSRPRFGATVIWHSQHCRRHRPNWKDLRLAQ